MTSSADTSAPAGITWELAMENAAQILSGLSTKQPKMGNPEWWSARSSQAQAWIAFARELTMHARAAR